MSVEFISVGTFVNTIGYTFAKANPKLSQMKRFLILTLIVFSLSALTSCGGKSDKEKTTTETEQVSEPSSTPDYDGLIALAQKSGDLTSGDYDFLLDQTEVFTNMAIKMGKEEYEKYISNLTEEQMGAIFELGALTAAANKGKLSDSQLKRFNELKEKDPTK